MGINASHYPYFLCMDADSILQHDSLEKIVRPVLEDANVVAVGGAVRPCNGAEIENGQGGPLPDARKTAGLHAGAGIRPLLPGRPHPVRQVQRQHHHLRRLWPVSKRAWSSRRAATTTPPWGRIWSWWSSCTSSAGRHGRPYRIRYATDAVCWTQVPESLGDLCKQRRRWHIGLVPEHEKAPKHFGKPQIRGRQFCLLPLFFDL